MVTGDEALNIIKTCLRNYYKGMLEDFSTCITEVSLPVGFSEYHVEVHDAFEYFIIDKYKTFVSIEASHIAEGLHIHREQSTIADTLKYMMYAIMNRLIKTLSTYEFDERPEWFVIDELKSKLKPLMKDIIEHSRQ